MIKSEYLEDDIVTDLILDLENEKIDRITEDSKSNMAILKHSIEVEKNPDPHPSLLEKTVHAQLMDGSFKDQVVWNPTIDGEKQLGGYYMYEGKYIKLEDLKTVNKVDLEFETQMAEFVNDARKLGAANNWNDDSRREVISGMMNLAKSSPEKFF